MHKRQFMFVHDWKSSIPNQIWSLRFCPRTHHLPLPATCTRGRRAFDMNAQFFSLWVLGSQSTHGIGAYARVGKVRLWRRCFYRLSLLLVYTAGKTLAFSKDYTMELGFKSLCFMGRQHTVKEGPNKQQADRLMQKLALCKRPLNVWHLNLNKKTRVLSSKLFVPGLGNIFTLTPIAGDWWMRLLGALSSASKGSIWLLWSSFLMLYFVRVWPAPFEAGMKNSASLWHRSVHMFNKKGHFWLTLHA